MPDVDTTTHIKLHVDQLRKNLDSFSEDIDIAPVIKANAYGHGATLVAEALANHPSIAFFAVASYREAVQLREAGITIPILVIGYVAPRVIASNSYPNISFAAVSFDHLQVISDVVGDQVSLHLKVDTGMNRYGLHLDEMEKTCTFLNSHDHLTVTGVFSHLADAYSACNSFTDKQIADFNMAVEKVTSRFPDCTYTHLAATAGHKMRDKISANVERVGIGLYGMAEYGADADVAPVLSLHSEVATVKSASAGTPVGYERTHILTRDTKLATIPAGYHEAVDRRLSDCGVVTIKEEECPILGRVSMNVTVVDVTDCANKISPGDPVTIISSNPDDPHSVQAIADKINTIPYVITTNLPASLPRLLA